jgi:sterol desaturase/sphingolipid hydroxylase (fatty acid hydroxylase superfamily)
MRKLVRIGATGAMVAVALVVRPEVLVGLVILAAVLVPLELAFALHRRNPLRAGWRTDVAHFAVSSLLTSGGVVVAVLVVAVPLRLTMPSVVPDTIAALPGFAQFVIALGIAEVAAYGAHRAAHEVPVLWRFHKVHHASPRLDWLASAHLHPIDQVWIRSIAVVPLVVLGFTRATFGAYLAFAAVQAIVVHANVRFRFGPLRWLIATPEYHHWHHANEAAHRNVNYAGFPIVDALFGTLHLPRRWPERYGVDEPQPDGYLAQLRWSFR